MDKLFSQNKLIQTPQVFSPFFKWQKVFIEKIFSKYLGSEYVEFSLNKLAYVLRSIESQAKKHYEFTLENFDNNKLEKLNNEFLALTLYEKIFVKSNDYTLADLTNNIKINYIELLLSCANLSEVNLLQVMQIEHTAKDFRFSSYELTKVIEDIFSKSESECFDIAYEKLKLITNELETLDKEKIIENANEYKKVLIFEVLYFLKSTTLVKKCVFDINIFSKTLKFQNTFYRNLNISKAEFTKIKNEVKLKIKKTAYQLSYKKKTETIKINLPVLHERNGVALKGVRKMADKLFQVTAESLGEEFKLSYKVEGDIEEKFTLPDLSDDDIVHFHYVDRQNEEKDFSKTYSELKKFFNDSLKLDNIEEQIITEYIGNNFEHLERLPQVTYEDVTEHELFGSIPIGKSDLTDKQKGLWAFHGKRKFHFTVQNAWRAFFDQYSESITPSFKLSFDKYNDEILETPIFFDVEQKTVESTNDDEEDFAADNTLELVSYIDTDILGKSFKDNTHQLTFLGNLEISFDDSENKTVKHKIIFPMRLCLQNTKYYPKEKKSCLPLQSTYVSIDFGTSSTCIAVQKGTDIEMIALSADYDGTDQEINRFENPTSLMIYRWEEIYQKWIEDYSNFPHTIKGSIDDARDRDSKKVDYDFGYGVKSVLQDAGSREFNSILSEIKMLPYYINQGEQITLEPYIKGQTNTINIIADYKKQDEKNFDPVAFYGYLIGRVVNNPSRGTLFTKYAITFPIKFNKEVREKIKDSIEFGLLNSLPEPLRKAKDKNKRSLFTVQMKHSEPESYVGAIYGRYLKCNDAPKPFAIYDFGGGTLDFSFGLLREDDDSDVAIDIYGTSGNENMGGEYLISLLSLWLLTDDSNKDQIIENNISFAIPRYEKIPGGFPEDLISKTPSQLAKLNTQRVNEIISRKILEDSNSCSGATEEPIYLFNKNSDTIEVSLSVDYDKLKEKLKEQFRLTIEEFEKEVEGTFARSSDELSKHGLTDFKISDVNIFRSGNTSKSDLVTEIMEIVFPDNEIFLIDEFADGSEDFRYAITPKTAVAYGQLQLLKDGVDINRIGSDFKWYVGRRNKSDDSFRIIIARNATTDKWVKYCPVKDGAFTISYSNTEPKSENDCYSEFVEVDDDYDNYNVYIRILTDSDTQLEYCLAEKNKKDDSDFKPLGIIDLEDK